MGPVPNQRSCFPSQFSGSSPTGYIAGSEVMICFFVVYATTAANGHESSYACYYDKKRKTYLGDLYSVNWMENSDVSNLNTETLASQFGQ